MDIWRAVGLSEVQRRIKMAYNNNPANCLSKGRTMKPVVDFPIENEMHFQSPILMHRVTLASVVLEGCYTQRHHLRSPPRAYYLVAGI
jgi:hypothetical protein